MMLQVMAYSIGVAAALSVVGSSMERVATLRRLPRRAGWIVVMLLSVLLPAAMILLARPAAVDSVSPSVVQASAPIAAPAPEDFSQPLMEFAPERVTTAPSPEAPRSTAWRIPKPADGQLLKAWLFGSVAVALYLSGAGLALWRRAASWFPARILGQDVLVSEVTGPALLGVLRPRIVVPRWLLSQPAASQALILEHERQHMLARDPLLILAGWLLIAAVPWNALLWWQWRRMRQAIELDCDARVMRGGAEATTYAEVLLAVTQRAARIPAGALAMSEPVHALERRIADLIPDVVRYARLQIFAVLMLAIVGAGAALALEAPALPDPAAATVPTAVPPEATGSRAPYSVPAPPSEVVPAGNATVVAAAQGAIVAAAPPSARDLEPVSTTPAPALAQAASVPASFMVRILSPVAEPLAPTLFALRPASPKPAGAPNAAAKARLEKYFSILTEKLRAVPGLVLITENTPGVPGVPFEIVTRLSGDWQGVTIEAAAMFQSSGHKVLWTTRDSTDFDLTPRLTAFWDDIPADDPDVEMENLVQRMRLELFPPDRAFLDKKASEFRDPQLPTNQRRYALYQLMTADRRRVALPGRLSITYLPDPALIKTATDVAMTSSDPALRLQIWDALVAPLIPRVDPAVLIASAERALAKETDTRVQLALINILIQSVADPKARAVLDTIANSESEVDRPALVRMAARRVLSGNAGWSDYIVSTLNDPQVPDAERLELISYVYSISTRVMLGDAGLRMDDAVERSVAGLVTRQESPEVAVAAASLLALAGGAVSRKEFVNFLSAGTGQPMADNKVRRSVLSALALSLRSHPENRPLFEDVMERDRDPAMREAARQALDQTK